MLGRLSSRATRGVCAAAVAVLGIALAPTVAAAGGDGVKAVSAYGGIGGYTLTDPEEAPVGGVLGVEFERGFSDALAVRVGGEGAIYHGTESKLTYAGRATAGVVYAFDVLKYVPYAGLGIGAAVLGGGVDLRLDPYIELAGGLDILTSRSFSYGAVVRVESFLLSSAAASVGLRATWRWGFF